MVNKSSFSIVGGDGLADKDKEVNSGLMVSLKHCLGFLKSRPGSSHRLWQLLLALCVFGCVAYLLLVSTAIASDADSRLTYHSRTDSDKAQVTVVMNTFKRHDMMIGSRFLHPHLSLPWCLLSDLLCCCLCFIEQMR